LSTLLGIGIFLITFFDPPTLLRPKLYFDLYFSTNNKSRFAKKGRSTQAEVKRTKYRMGRRYEIGRRTEKSAIFVNDFSIIEIRFPKTFILSVF